MSQKSAKLAASTKPTRGRNGTLGLFYAPLVLAGLFEVLRIYWIMPFPGSQRGQTLGWAYFFDNWIWLFRLVVGAALLVGGARLWARGGWWVRVPALFACGLFAALAFQTNGPQSAEGMFRQPTVLSFSSATSARLAWDDLVIGVELEGPDGSRKARAYPLRMIAHHHQVRDFVAGQAIMVTYCSVCRSGRVWSPVVDGKPDHFRLVGMDHWNAMFEDERTGTWWRQASGEAVIGPLRGRQLSEIPSVQMGWEAWKSLHPGTDALDPDPDFVAKYEGLEAFERGTISSSLLGRDTASWGEKSWVVGVVADGAARAFDWNELVREKVVRDQVGAIPVVLMLGADGTSFYAFDARPPFPPGAPPLALERTSHDSTFFDPLSHTHWTDSGFGLDDPYRGSRLTPLPAYQEFWHSWRTFNPATSARR